MTGSAGSTGRETGPGAARDTPGDGGDTPGNGGDTPGDRDDTPGLRGAEPIGIWFGVDVGSVRVGVARCDPQGIMAVPVTTLRRSAHDNRDVAEMAALVVEYEAAGVVLGLPRTLAGREGPSAEMARAYGAVLAERIAPVPVEFIDERLTTVSAQRKLHDGGLRGPAGRAVIDQAAAVELLEHWLDSRRGARR